MRVDCAARGRRLDILEAVDEVERRRVEQRELLLHRHREVSAGFELLACELELLLRAQALLVAHGSGEISPMRTEDDARRRPSSSARPPPGGRPDGGSTCPPRRGRAPAAAWPSARLRRPSGSSPARADAPGT